MRQTKNQERLPGLEREEKKKKQRDTEKETSKQTNKIFQMNELREREKKVT